MELLFANGADLKSVPLAHVLLGWEPTIIRFFLDHGADAITDSPFAAAFGERVRTALRPFIEYRQTHPELATELQKQVDCALRRFCEEGNLKWISLLIWAGADPRTRGPKLDDKYADDPERYTSGLSEACYAGHVEALKKLKPEAGRDDLSDLLQCAAISGHRDTLQYLLELGANSNDKVNGASSALDKCLWHLNFGPFDVYRSKRLRSRYDVDRALECVGKLVAHGAIWRPASEEEKNSLRRALYGCESSVTIDLLRLFLNYNACSSDAVQELLRTPRMKQHLSTETWPLARLGLKLETRQARKPQPPPAALLNRFNRAQLYEELWTEPTRTVAKRYGVSDVWLSKVCKALQVPRPGRGYWAKKTAGQPVGKRPRLTSLR